VLLPGQFVRVRVNGAIRPSAILVPQRAVLEGPNGKFVYVVREGKAEPRPVQVGDWHDKQWIISQGLEEGDSVIVDGVVKVRPGLPVKLTGQAQAPVSRTGPVEPVVPGLPGKAGASDDILS
jgi:membrane fusion protein (multidrug efflux system)